MSEQTESVVTAEDQIIKEGIDVSMTNEPEKKPSQSEDGASGDSPTQESKEDSSAQEKPLKETTEVPRETAKEPVSSDDPVGEVDWSKVPAHLHPFTKQLLSERKQLRDELRQRDDILKDKKISRTFAESASEEETPQVTKKPQGLSDDQLKAIEELGEIIGVKDLQRQVQTLTQVNQDMTKAQENRAFEDVENQIRKDGEKYGLDWETEIEPTLRTWFSQNPKFHGLGPDSLQLAYRACYFDKMDELKERATNLRLIKEQKKAKEVNAEKPSGKLGKGSRELEPSMEQYMERRIREEGGITLE